VSPGTLPWLPSADLVYTVPDLVEKSTAFYKKKKEWVFTPTLFALRDRTPKGSQVKKNPFDNLTITPTPKIVNNFLC